MIRSVWLPIRICFFFSFVLFAYIGLKLHVDLVLRGHVVDQIGDVVGSLNHIANDADEADLMKAQVAILEDTVLALNLLTLADDLRCDRHDVLD